MAMDQMEAARVKLDAAIAQLRSAIDNCDDSSDRGFMLVGLNILERRLVNIGVPGARNCSPLLGAQIGEYKICSFMGVDFYRDVFDYSAGRMSRHSSGQSKLRKVFIRRTLEANESKPHSNSQYLYLLRCSSESSLGVMQSSYSLCRKMLLLGKRQKRTTHAGVRFGVSMTSEEYAHRVMENLVELGAAEKGGDDLYRLI